MEHRAVFWHLISLHTQGSVSQTSPPGSHFIISLLPIRTLPAAHTVAFFIYVFLLFLSNRAVFCLKAPWNYSYCQPASSSSSTEAGGRKTHRFIRQKTKKKKKNALVHANTQAHLHTHTHTNVSARLLLPVKAGRFLWDFAAVCARTHTCTTGIAPPFLPDRFWQTQMAFFLVFELFFVLFFMSPWKKSFYAALQFSQDSQNHLTQSTVAFYEINTVRLEIRREINGFMIILQAEIRWCPTCDAVSISHWAFFQT